MMDRLVRRLFRTGLITFFIVCCGIADGISQTPVIKGINHIALAVEDIPRSKQFYEYIIGLKPIQVPDELKSIRAWFQIAPGQELHLLAGRKKPVHHDRNGSHISLTIEDADAIEAYLKLQSIEYHRQERFDGVSQIYISDPDGYVIEFNEAKR